MTAKRIRLFHAEIDERAAVLKAERTRQRIVLASLLREQWMDFRTTKHEHVRARTETESYGVLIFALRAGIISNAGVGEAEFSRLWRWVISWESRLEVRA